MQKSSPEFYPHSARICLNSAPELPEFCPNYYIAIFPLPPPPSHAPMYEGVIQTESAILCLNFLERLVTAGVVLSGRYD